MYKRIMTRTSFLLLLFCLLAIGAYANETQSQTQELKDRIEKMSGKEKVDALNKLSTLYQSDNQFIEATVSAREALDIASRLNDQSGMATAHDNLGLIYEHKFDYTNAMKSFVSALKLRNESGNDKAIALSKNNIGRVFYLQEDAQNAIENLSTALELRTKINDREGAARTHKNLADVFLFKKLYGKAKDHYRQSMDLLIELDDLEGAARIANFLGEIVKDLGDYEGALVYYNMSLDLNSSIENVPNIGNDHNNIALAQFEQGSYEEAIESNETAMRIRQHLKDDFGLAETYKNFGLIYQAMGDKLQAKHNLEAAIKTLKSVGLQPGTQNIYRDIAKTYTDMGEYELAYINQVAYSDSRDAFMNQEKSRAILELTTKYESEFAAEQQQQKIEALEKDKAYNSQIRTFLMALVCLGALLIVVLFRSYKQKQADNQLLRTKNEEIRKQKEEIDIKNSELEEKNASLDLLNSKLVDEMAERESIEKSSFARDRFLATMSHEMRTPMNIIIGLTHLLLDEEPREDQIEHLRTLQFSANNLLVFINDVLDFSKIEAGKLSLESRVFDPVKTFEELRIRFRLPAQEKEVKLNFNVDRKIPEKLMGDPTRLNQILTNLITNSIQHVEKGEVKVEAFLKEMTNQEAMISLKISDTGKGIPQNMLDAMFRRFPNNSDSFEGYNGGAAFGLAITKRLVDLQNGKIEVTSTDEGTTFNILLPYKIVTDEAAAKAEKEVKEPKTYEHLAGNKILIVEDNKINQLVVAKMLKKLGIEITTADNGLEALDAFENSYFDLVLMDIQMPGMDGYRATAEIRKLSDPRKRDVPIIALTASAFLSEKEKAKLFGMNDHVGKPFGPDDLMEKISACLNVYKV